MIPATVSVDLPRRRVLSLLLRHDFCCFVRQVFATLHPGEVYDDAWHVEHICLEVEKFLAGGDLQLLLNAPPRSLKSIIVSIALPAFVLGRMPWKRILCASYSLALAEAFARDTQKVMQSSWYREAFPATVLARTPEEGLFTSAGGYRRTISVTGSVTGFGGDLIIVDDPIKADEIYSNARREKVKGWFVKTLLSRRNDMRHSKIVLVMQRLHVDDLSAVVLQRPKTKHIRLPAQADRDYAFALRHGRVRHWEEGEYLQSRQPPQELGEQRQALGEREYAAQYLQEPVPPDGGVIKWSWFKRYEALPAYRPTDRRIFSWDTALSEAGTADYSVCTEWLVRDRQFYLVNVIRERLLYPDLRRRIAQQNAVRGNSIIIVEDKGSGMSVAQDLKRDRINIISYKPEGSKEQRASIASPQIEAGNVLVPTQAPWLPDFQAECMAFPNGRHDDQVDSMSQAIIWFLNRPKPATTVFGTY